jgi:hypothetical protein
MKVIKADGVNQAFHKAVDVMLNDDYWRTISPRDGVETREYLEPVATVYSMPWRRVLFNEVRDANPFFHLMEALWMLAGRDDAAWIGQFSKNISQFAEDDGKFHGAYGYRWRNMIDQLHALGQLIRREPETRRAVLAMWNPVADLNAQRRDLPCNTHVYFKPREGKLHMTVCCRSNDIIWGCYGANAVHFSVLQEYMAAMVGMQMGTYTHVSDSWHYYTNNPTYKKLAMGAAYGMTDYYQGHGMTPARIDSIAVVNQSIDVWDADLARFFTDDWDDPVMYQDLFFSRTAYPMRDAWRNHKRGDYDTALHLCKNIASPDWQLAATQWMQRRAQRATETQG